MNKVNEYVVLIYSIVVTCPGQMMLYSGHLRVQRDIGERSKPVRSAKASLTRFGYVLRSTNRPSELNLWQLHCKTLPAAPTRRFGQRLAVVPRPGFVDPYA